MEGEYNECTYREGKTGRDDVEGERADVGKTRSKRRRENCAVMVCGQKGIMLKGNKKSQH